MDITLVTLLVTLLPTIGNGAGERIVYKKDGDFIIGGLVMVHGFNETTQTCGELGNIGALARVEAIAYAVSKLNNNSNILNGFSLGYEIYDTCASTADTVRHTLKFIPPLREVDNVLGIVGPQRSAASIQVTNILSVFNISMISFLSTSDELSNSQRYPYFLRTVPPDKFQVSVMIDLLVHYGWKYVAILYSDDPYGKNGEAEFASQAKDKEICIGYSKGITASADDIFFNETIKDLISLRKASPLSVVILFILREDVRPFFEHALAAGVNREFIWIGSDGWGNFGLDPLSGSEESAIGAFTIVPKTEPNVPFSSYFMSAINSSKNPWVPEFVRDAERYNKKFPQELPGPSYESIIIDSVEVFARGLNDMKNKLCDSSLNVSTCRAILLSNRRMLRDYLLKVSFPNENENLVSFTDNGDSKGRYDIMYLTQTDNGTYNFITAGTWLDGENTSLQIGNFEWYLKYEASSKGPTYNINNVPRSVCRDKCGSKQVRKDEIHGCCWTCSECEDNEIIRDNECISCFVRQNKTFMWPNLNLTQCIPVGYLKLRHEGENIAILTAASLGLVVELFVAYLYIKNREKKLIKASSRELGYVILVGVCLSYLSAILHSTPPFSFTCILRRIIPNIGTAFIYVSLATMTIRLHRIFTSGKKTAKRAKFISPMFQVMVTLMFSLIPLVWGLIWIFITPPDVDIIEPTKDRQIITSTCVVSRPHRLGQLVWDLLVVLVCCYFAFRTRNLPANYNQTRFIAFCVFSTLVVFIAFVPAFFRSQETSLNLYTAIGTIIQSTVVLLLVFVARIYALYFVNEEDQQLVPQRPSTQITLSTEGKDPVNTVSEHVVSDKTIPSIDGKSSLKTVSDFSSQTTEVDLCNYSHYASNEVLNKDIQVMNKDSKASNDVDEIIISVTKNDSRRSTDKDNENPEEIIE